MKASMNKFLRITLKSVVLVVFLVSGMVGGVALDRRILTAFVPLDNIPAHATSDFRLMAEAWNTIQRYYVDRAGVKPRILTYGSISGMVDALGDTGHSTFLTPDMVKKESDFSKGKFKGIGAEVQMKEGHVVIVTPLDGSPAQAAGLRPGDIILRVNGESISGLPLDQVVERIAGQAGTKVTLTLLTPVTGQTRTVTVVRAEITIHNVTWRKLPGTDVAHLRIAGFSEDVTENLKAALREIEQEGLGGLILDLRNDPGGLLDQAIGTASQFLTKGNVLIEKDAQGKETPTPVQPGGLAQSIPMVCLINQGTASAAEIVAGALKDAHRAKLVGETTFGTGTVLKEFPLSDGSSLLLAVEEWLTPDGHTIWHKGITPDIPVSLPQDVIPLTPSAERDMTPDQMRASKDEQLLRALELVSHKGGESPLQATKRSAFLPFSPPPGMPPLK
jgi:carboxyl-terminal processing protease